MDKEDVEMIEKALALGYTIEQIRDITSKAEDYLFNKEELQ